MNYRLPPQPHEWIDRSRPLKFTFEGRSYLYRYQIGSGALALVPTAFAVSAFLSGLGRIGPSRASIASSVEPAVAVGCGVLVLGERLLPIQFVGAGLVILAVLAIELRKLPRVPVPPIPRVRLMPRLVPRFPLPETES